MKKRLLFVYNPRSGKGRVKNKISEIVDVFIKGGYEVMIHPTQSAGDATRIIAEYGKEMDLIVCSGGDGSLNEAIAGLKEHAFQVPFGFIPAGSTNDYAHSLSVPRNNPVKAAEDIMNGTVGRYDVGLFGDKPFIYIAAFGLFTNVAYETDQNLKNVLGYAAYLLEAGKQYFHVPSFHLTVEGDGFKEEGYFSYGMITNTKFVGGMKRVAGKQVVMDDGIFEIALVYTPKNKLELNSAIGGVVSGDESNKHVLRFKSSWLRIESDSDLPWTLDGESGGNHKVVEIHVEKQAVQIVTK